LLRRHNGKATFQKRRPNVRCLLVVCNWKYRCRSSRYKNMYRWITISTVELKKGNFVQDFT